MLEKLIKTSVVSLTSNPKQILFPLITEDLYLLSSSQLNGNDLGDSLLYMENLLLPFKQIYALFPNLAELNEELTLRYSTTGIEQSCIRAIEFFGNIITKSIPNNVSSKLLEEDIMKIFVICLKYLNRQLMDCICEKSLENIEELLKHLGSLNCFIALTLHDPKNPVVMARYDTVIFQIVKETLEELYVYLENLYKIKSISLIARFFNYQFQILAVLNALNEVQKPTNDTAYESIKASLNLFENSISKAMNSPLLGEIFGYYIGENENWINDNHNRLAITCKRKKFSIILINSDPPKFTLRYMNLYHISNLYYLIIKEESMKSLIKILKELSEFISSRLNNPIISKQLTLDIELSLNETLVCLRILKLILPNMEQSIKLLEKLQYIIILKPLIENFISLVLKLKSCDASTTNPYISEIFHIMNYDASSEISIKNKSPSYLLRTLVEEIIGDIITLIDTEDAMQLRHCIIDNLFNNRHIKSWKTLEYIIKLIKTSYSHFNRYQFLKDTASNNIDSIDNITDTKIIMILNDIVEHNKIWTEELLKEILNIIHKASNEIELFRIYKLLFCIIKGEVHNNTSFFTIINTDIKKDITYTEDMECKKRKELIVIKVFSEIKGIDEIGSIVLKYLVEGNNESIKKMNKNLFIELVPYFSEEIIKRNCILKEFFSYCKENTWVKKVTMQLLHVLLKKVKYCTEITKKEYLPLTLIEIIEDVRGHKDILDYIELLINFLSYEIGAPELLNHQVYLNKNKVLDSLFKVLKDNSSEPFIGELTINFFKFLINLRKQNQSLATEVNNSPLIRKKLLLDFTKDIISKSLINVVETESFLNLLLEITFDSSIDYVKPSPLTIKHYKFLLFYLSIISILPNYTEFTKFTMTNFRTLCKMIENSYYNCLICSKYRIFSKLITLMKKGTIPGILECVADLCTKIITINTSNQCLKTYIEQLNIFEENHNESLCISVLNSLIQALDVDNPREVFSFVGKVNSGIKLIPRKGLPKEGFCFCGYIYLEYRDEQIEDMTIFKLCATKNEEIELFIRDNFINYQENVTKSIIFSQTKIEHNKWYFLELYHLNNESQKNLLLYFNSELVQVLSFEQYCYKLNYENNTIGCTIDSEDNENITHKFQGQITSLCFIEVNSKTFSFIHNSLSKRGGYSEFESFENVNSELWERVFMYINPQCEEDLNSSDQRVFAIKSKGQNIEIFNSIEKVYSRITIYHLMLGKDVFLNLGGIRTVIPILYSALNNNYKSDFM